MCGNWIYDMVILNFELPNSQFALSHAAQWRISYITQFNKNEISLVNMKQTNPIALINFLDSFYFRVKTKTNETVLMLRIKKKNLKKIDDFW